MAMFLSIFGKPISPACFYCSNSLGNFEMTFELFGYQYFQFPVYEMSMEAEKCQSYFVKF